MSKKVEEALASSIPPLSLISLHSTVLLITLTTPEAFANAFLHKAFTCLLRLCSGHFRILSSLPCTYFSSSNVVLLYRN